MVTTRRTRAQKAPSGEADVLSSVKSDVSPRKTRSGRTRERLLTKFEPFETANSQENNDSNDKQAPRKRGRPLKKVVARKNGSVQEKMACLSNGQLSPTGRIPLSEVIVADSHAESHGSTSPRRSVLNLQSPIRSIAKSNIDTPRLDIYKSACSAGGIALAKTPVTTNNALYSQQAFAQDLGEDSLVKLVSNVEGFDSRNSKPVTEEQEQPTVASLESLISGMPETILDNTPRLESQNLSVEVFAPEQLNGAEHNGDCGSKTEQSDDKSGVHLVLPGSPEQQVALESKQLSRADLTQIPETHNDDMKGGESDDEGQLQQPNASVQSFSPLRLARSLHQSDLGDSVTVEAHDLDSAIDNAETDHAPMDDAEFQPDTCPPGSPVVRLHTAVPSPQTPTTTWIDGVKVVLPPDDWTPEKQVYIPLTDNEPGHLDSPVRMAGLGFVEGLLSPVLPGSSAISVSTPYYDSAAMAQTGNLGDCLSDVLVHSSEFPGAATLGLRSLDDLQECDTLHSGGDSIECRIVPCEAVQDESVSDLCETNVDVMPEAALILSPSIDIPYLEDDSLVTTVEKHLGSTQDDVFDSPFIDANQNLISDAEDLTESVVGVTQESFSGFELQRESNVGEKKLPSLPEGGPENLDKDGSEDLAQDELIEAVGDSIVSDLSVCQPEDFTARSADNTTVQMVLAEGEPVTASPVSTKSFLISPSGHACDEQHRLSCLEARSDDHGEHYQLDSRGTSESTSDLTPVGTAITDATEPLNANSQNAPLEYTGSLVNISIENNQELFPETDFSPIRLAPSTEELHTILSPVVHPDDQDLEKDEIMNSIDTNPEEACVKVDDDELLQSTFTVKQQKKSSSRRQSRRQSYMTATKSIARERELEMQNKQAEQQEEDLQLAAEIDLAAIILQEVPGSVERKRTKRRSSTTRESPSKNRENSEIRLTRSRASIGLEAFSPVTLGSTMPLGLSMDQAATKIQALFRGWLRRKELSKNLAQPCADSGLEHESDQEEKSSESNAEANQEVQPPQEEDSQRPGSRDTDIDDVFSDFLSKWQSKKSMKAKIEDMPDLTSPRQTNAPDTPRRVPAGTVSPTKGLKTLLAPVPSSAQKTSRQSTTSSRTSRSRLPAMRMPLAVTAPDEVEARNSLLDKDLEPKRNRARMSKAQTASAMSNHQHSPGKATSVANMDVEKKRKVAEVDATLPSRKKARTMSKASVPQSGIPVLGSLPIARTKTPPVKLETRPTPPTTPKRLLYLTPAEVTKTTRSFTSQNRLYRCDFDRVVVRKEIPRPPSPTAKIQAKMASNAKAKRKRWMKERGYMFGAGDEEDYYPKIVTPERKTVKWEEALEVDLSMLPKTSPTKVKSIEEVPPCIAPVALDDYGNLEDNTPLTPELGKAPKILITKYLYKGEQDD